jgi:hypothetical protein
VTALLLLMLAVSAAALAIGGFVSLSETARELATPGRLCVAAFKASGGGTTVAAAAAVATEAPAEEDAGVNETAARAEERKPAGPLNGGGTRGDTEPEEIEGDEVAGSSAAGGTSAEAEPAAEPAATASDASGGAVRIAFCGFGCSTVRARGVSPADDATATDNDVRSTNVRGDGAGDGENELGEADMGDDAAGRCESAAAVPSMPSDGDAEAAAAAAFAESPADRRRRLRASVWN